MVCRSTTCWWVVALAIIAGVSDDARAGFLIEDLGTVFPSRTSGSLGINANGGTAGMMNLPGNVTVAASSQLGGALQQVVVPTNAISSVANAINASGSVAGNYTTSSGQQLGFSSAGGAATAIGPLTYGGGTGTYTIATGINDSGQVVGSGNLPGISSRAFISSGSSVTLIAPLGGANAGTSPLTNSANGINSLGVVVGSSETFSGGPNQAFYTGLNNVPIALSTRNSSGIFLMETQGVAIANDNDIVGYGSVGGYEHAFYAASTGGSLVDLGTLANSPNSMALGVNDSALVVGTSGGDAFLYSASTGMVNLNSLISTTNQSSWLLTEATGINDSDQICGEGYINGVLHGFLLTPIPGESIFFPPSAVPTPPSIVMSLIGVVLACGWSIRRFRHERSEDQAGV